MTGNATNEPNCPALDRINVLGDRPENGMRQSHGLMVNYRYELDRLRRAARHGGRGIDRETTADYPV